MYWIRRHLTAVIVVLLALSATAVYYPHSQQAHMAKAQRHIAVLRPILQSDPRFRAIELAPFTGRGGSLMVRGALASQAGKEALIAIVEQSKPPVAVVYRIEISPASKPALREGDEPVPE